MTYDEIMSISDFELRNQKLYEFYTQEVKIQDWINQDNTVQKIRFNDRWEYRKNGKFHRLDGPAIDYHNSGGGYYIEGVKMDFEEWKPVAQRLLREKKLERLV